MPISVITSKKAQGDFMKIKARHADILTAMTNQKLKVDAYNQQKAAEKQNEQIMQNEMKKEQMTQSTATQKNSLDFQTKNAELDIRKAEIMKP